MNSPDADPDRDDVRRVLAGDASAFEGIVRRWQGPLVNLAYRFCRHPGRAEEMAQDAFLRVFRFLDRWRDDAAFSTWLFAVATNVYRSHLRRMRPEEVPLESQVEARGSANPAADAERDETAEVVRRTVAHLPARYRDAMVLFYFHDLDIAETARQLGLPQGTVKARLHRARGLLQRRLAGLAGSKLTTEAT